MPETLKTLLAKREILMNRADSLRKNDPKMADYLDGLGNAMDSELEGVDDIQERDPNGFLQGEDPDYIAFNAAQARISGRPTEDDPDIKKLSVSPTFQVAFNNHLGEQMRNQWNQQFRANAQTPEGAGRYDNSVTPSASALAEIAQRRQKEEELRAFLGQ